MSGEPRQHVLRGTTSCGWSILVGPVDVGEGVILVEEHMAPNGWTPEFLPLTPLEQAVKHFTAGKNPQPVPEADFFVALRRAIICHEDNDGADCYRSQALIAHAERHRPRWMYTGPEECALGECDHDTEDGRCPDVEPTEPICASCSLIRDTHSEFGPEFHPECRVEWPCEPLEQVARFYGVSFELAGVYG